MSDQGLGDFARMVRHDPRDAARKLKTALPEEDVLALVHELDNASTSPSEWASLYQGRPWPASGLGAHVRRLVGYDLVRNDPLVAASLRAALDGATSAEDALASMVRVLADLRNRPVQLRDPPRWVSSRQ